MGGEIEFAATGKCSAMSQTAVPPPPVLRVTSYDRAVAGVVTTVVAMLAVCGLVGTVWVLTRQPAPARAVPLELVEFSGGVADGAIDETLRVDSPDAENPDASPADEISEVLEIAESLESITELSDAAAEPVQQQFESGLKNTGQRGSASGTGRRALGSGGGAAGIPREQRWFVRFADDADLDEYARQLDFFRIELGALLPGGELVYLTAVSAPAAQVRRVKTGGQEARLYMTWQGGQRRFADAQLFQRAGINVPGDAPLFHFYPPDVEAALAQLERDFRGRPVTQIKRTYFHVTRQPQAGYRFEVSRQLYNQ